MRSTFKLAQFLMVSDTDEVLGCGAFGIVYKGEYNNKLVAIKTVSPDNSSEGNVLTLFEEIKLMCHLNVNQYIVGLVGASTVGINEGKVLALFEMCPLGSLLNHLRGIESEFINLLQEDCIISYSSARILMGRDIDVNDDSVSSRSLISWSCQISKGMEYLIEKQVSQQCSLHNIITYKLIVEILQVIHGDLATRNVLLYDNNNIKICDFGLSRKLYTYSVYKKSKQVSYKLVAMIQVKLWPLQFGSTFDYNLFFKEPLPWRWLAIEVLRDLEFSHESDVWAYGVTLWEIFSLGELPFAEVNWSQDIVNQLEGGLKLKKPKYSTHSL
jgi:serine/threonine protein kinase